MHRHKCLVLSMIAAAIILLLGAPVGALAAGEESSGGSASGEAVVEPSGDSAKPAPTSTEWSPQGSGGGASSDEAPLQRGSSVGSGVVPGRTGSTGSAGSDSEAPPTTPAPGGSYEPEQSTASIPSTTLDEPASPPRAGSRTIQSAQPTATSSPKAGAGADVNAEVGAATPVAHSASSQGSDIGSAPPAAAASFTASDDGASTSSYALPLLLGILVLGLVLGFAGVRFKRRRKRRRLEALWREQDAVWEAALRRAELGQVAGDSEPSTQPLQQINVG